MNGMSLAPAYGAGRTFGLPGNWRLRIDDDGAFVENPPGTHTGSLARVVAEGTVDDGRTGDELQVPTRVLERLEVLVDANGEVAEWA